MKAGKSVNKKLSWKPLLYSILLTIIEMGMFAIVLGPKAVATNLRYNYGIVAFEISFFLVFIAGLCWLGWQKASWAVLIICFIFSIIFVGYTVYDSEYRAKIISSLAEQRQTGKTNQPPILPPFLKFLEEPVTLIS